MIYIVELVVPGIHWHYTTLLVGAFTDPDLADTALSDALAKYEGCTGSVTEVPADQTAANLTKLVKRARSAYHCV